MWFQAAEWNAFNASLLVKFNKQQLSDFLTENLPILNAYLPQKSENLQPHSSNSIKNATPLYSLQSWKCNPIQRHIPIRLL